MKFPQFDNIQFVDEKGHLSHEWRHNLMQTYQALNDIGSWRPYSDATTEVRITPNRNYFSSGTTQMPFSLPLNLDTGDSFTIASLSATGFKINQGEGQFIQFQASQTTPGIGHGLQCTVIGAAVTLVCMPNTLGFIVTSFVPTLTVF